MTTIVKLGLGTIKVGVKGVKLFVDAVGGKTPDMRIDEGEGSNGPNSETHVHFGDGEGQSIGGEAMDLLLGAASTNYHSRREDSLKERDYIFSDEYTLRYSRRY
jgi:hypothetical protein